MLARRTVVGLPDTAPPLDDTKKDLKPDVYGEAEYQQEKGKEMMQGWLVKKEDEVDVKPEPGAVDVKLEEGSDGVKLENGVESKEQLVELKPDVKPKPKGRTLVVMGTYSIGKERIVKGASRTLLSPYELADRITAVAKALGTTIYCDPRKKGILLCETDPDLHAMLSSDPIAVSPAHPDCPGH